MGRNIRVYLNDDLLDMVEAHGQSSSEIVQEALEGYYQSQNREGASKRVPVVSRLIKRSEMLREAIAEWKRIKS